MNARGNQGRLTAAVLAAVRGKSDTQQHVSAKVEIARVPEAKLARLIYEEEL